MHIIPVIDISKGVVVHAVKGDRDKYRPITSQLCTSANPIEVINGFLDIYDFRTVYIADLDALQQQGNNTGIIRSISNTYPELEIWLDSGLALMGHYIEDLMLAPLRMILATESMGSISTFTSTVNKYASHRFILSIDYIAGKILGPYEKLQVQSQLPADILILNLDQVGANQGITIPDQLNQNSIFKTHKIYYGGGIRNSDDLLRLESLGLSGALLATALHCKTITRDDLEALIG